MSPSTRTLTLLALLCPSFAAECTKGSCMEDDTSLVQVRSTVKRGNDRAAPAEDAQKDAAKEDKNFPYDGHGLGYGRGYGYYGHGYSTNAAPDSSVERTAWNDAKADFVGDATVARAGADAAAADATGIQEDINGQDENNFVNAKMFAGTNDEAAARAYVANTDAQTRADALAVANAEKAASAELVADAKSLAAANAYSWAAQTKDAQEYKTAKAQHLADATKVANAVTDSNRAWMTAAERNAYANAQRTAHSEEEFDAVANANFVKDTQEAIAARNAATTRTESKWAALEAAERQKLSDVVKAADTVNLADAMKATRVEKEFNTEAVETAMRAEETAHTVDEVRERDAAMAANTHKSDVAQAVNAARAEQAANDWKVQQAMDYANAKAVTDAEKVAHARTVAAEREMAAANTWRQRNAGAVAHQVEEANIIRSAERANAARAEELANTRAVQNDQEFAQAHAAALAWTKQQVGEADAANSEQMAKDVAVANAVRTRDNVLAEAVERNSMANAYDLAKAERTVGANVLSNAKRYAAQDAASANHAVHDADVLYADHAANDATITSDLDAASKAATGEFDAVDEAVAAHRAGQMENLDEYAVADDVTAVDTAKAAQYAGATDISGDYLAGTAGEGLVGRGRGYGAGFGADGLAGEAAFAGEGLEGRGLGYGAGFGARGLAGEDALAGTGYEGLGYGSEVGAGAADDLSGVENAATSSATGVVDDFDTGAV